MKHFGVCGIFYSCELTHICAVGVISTSQSPHTSPHKADVCSYLPHENDVDLVRIGSQSDPQVQSTYHVTWNGQYLPGGVWLELT